MSRHFPSAELVLAWFCGLSSRPRVLSLDRCGASGANGNSGDAVSRDEVGFVGTIWRGMHVRDAAGYLFDSWITWWSVRNSIHRLVICVFPVVNDHHLDWNVDDISCQMMNIYIYNIYHIFAGTEALPPWYRRHFIRKDDGPENLLPISAVGESFLVIFRSYSILFFLTYGHTSSTIQQKKKVQKRCFAKLVVWLGSLFSFSSRFYIIFL